MHYCETLMKFEHFIMCEIRDNFSEISDNDDFSDDEIFSTIALPV